MNSDELIKILKRMLMASWEQEEYGVCRFCGADVESESDIDTTAHEEHCLYGVLVTGTVPQGYWFDVTRVEIDKKKCVVEMPNFYQGYVAEGRKGASVKPKLRA